MRKILIILLLLVSLNTYSQRKEQWIKLGMFTASIALNAVGDGLNTAGNKDLGHLCNALSIGVTLSIPLVIDIKKDEWYWYLIEYSFIRFATFDYIYNISAGNDLGYFGQSHGYDKFLGRQNGWGVAAIKGTVLMIGISINFQKTKKGKFDYQ